MKTYEITFEEIKENCNHYIVDGLHQCVVVTMRDEQNNCIKFTANQCCEATCPIIKKLKEVKDGDSQINGIKNRISEITKVLDGKMKRLAVSARMANGNHAQEIYAHFKEELRWLKADIEKIIDEVKK